MTSERWIEAGGRCWTNKDLLGHLAAWSDLLMDQIEAIRKGCPDAVPPVDVDAWNALQVSRRRDWTVGEVITSWRRSAARALRAVDGLMPHDDVSRRWTVAWAAEPVSLEEIVALWVAHVGQHPPGAQAR